MAKGLDKFARRVDKMAKELTDGTQLRRTAKAAGMVAKPEVRSISGPATLGGDFAFSHWRDKAGELMPLEVAFSLHKADGGVTIHRARMSAGPWRVANDGRNQGDSGMLAGPGIIRTGANAGTTRRRKNGSVAKVREFKTRKWSGTTSGKGSWDQYEKLVIPKVRAVIEKETRAALARAVIGD